MCAWSAGQQRVVQRFTDACRDDDDVVAAFLGGSHASGTADAWADLDLYLITSDHGYDRFFARRREFLRRLGDPVLREAPNMLDTFKTSISDQYAAALSMLPAPAL